MKVLNKNVIVLLRNSVELKNGINLKETRGKRDIVTGIVFAADETLKIKDNTKVWFPLYASNEVIVDGKQYAVLNFDDIIMVQEDAKL
jgi:co-chaperonin GroES (HSP10)